MNKHIPIQKDKWSGPNDIWIDYKNKVYIIEHNENGNEAQFQFDGVSCRQGYVKGFLYKSYKSSSKWFKSDWWYKRTCWSQDPTKVHFHEKQYHTPNIGDRETKWKKLYEEATKDAIPVVDILNKIKIDVESHIKERIEFDFDDMEYGNQWFESYIPIKINEKKYLLTWHNCD